MGVTGLLGLLKSIQKPCNLKQFQGQVLGVDGYCWLHRGAVACAVDLALGKPCRKHVDFFMHRVRMLLHFGITPYIVFDGDHLPSKANTEHDRAARRARSRKTGLEMIRLNKHAQAYEELRKAIDVTPEMARQVIEELKAMRVDYIVAPYEADAQLAYMERKGLIHGIVSEDSDLLVFGAKCLLTKLDQYGDCIMLRKSDLSACREVNLVGWTSSEFRHMAILSGCDYLEGIPKMGLKTAHRMIRKYKTIERLVRCIQLEGKFRLSTDYLARFQQAEMTFLYQLVFCPGSQKLVHLTTPQPADLIDGMTFIGTRNEMSLARAIARGDVNPITKLAIVQLPQNALVFGKAMDVSLAQSAPKATVNSQKGTPIDTFFKPRRVPLAELDPNSLTPSRIQQQRLQNTRQSWPAISSAAPSGLYSSGAPTHQRLSMPESTTTSNKRRRLCFDDHEMDQPEQGSKKSCFFKESSVSLRKGAARDKSHDIHIFSDDSIENAMLHVRTPSTVENTGTCIRDGALEVPDSGSVEVVQSPIGSQHVNFHSALVKEAMSLHRSTSSRFMHAMQHGPAYARSTIASTNKITARRTRNTTCSEAVTPQHYTDRDLDNSNCHDSGIAGLTFEMKGSEDLLIQSRSSSEDTPHAIDAELDNSFDDSGILVAESPLFLKAPKAGTGCRVMGAVQGESAALSAEIPQSPPLRKIDFGKFRLRTADQLI